MKGENNPPQGIEPSELLLKLLERPAPSEIVDFPAKTPGGNPIGQIRVGVLRDDQLDEAKFRAKRYLKDKRQMSDAELSSSYGEKLMGDAIAKEILAMACFLVNPIPGTEESDKGPTYPMLFRSSADVRKLTSDEITALFGAYLIVQRMYGPNPSVMDESEVNAWIERLEVGASALPLGLLSSPQLEDLCMLLARRASTFSRLLTCQHENSPIPWESVPEIYRLDTASSSALAAADTLSGDDDRTITAEEAMKLAEQMIGR